MHPYAQSVAREARHRIDDMPRVLISELDSNDRTCGHCWCDYDSTEYPDTPVRLACGHIFGLQCIKEWLVYSLKDAQSSNDFHQFCPKCRQPAYIEIPSYGYAQVNRSKVAMGPEAYPARHFSPKKVFWLFADGGRWRKALAVFPNYYKDMWPEGLPKHYFQEFHRAAETVIADAERAWNAGQSWSIQEIERKLLDTLRQTVIRVVPKDFRWEEDQPDFVLDRVSFEALVVSFGNSCVRVIAGERYHAVDFVHDEVDEEPDFFPDQAYDEAFWNYEDLGVYWRGYCQDDDEAQEDPTVSHDSFDDDM